MNRLASATSPYLRQHASNPVDWYPWSDDAFDRARELDRPVLLSIGYSSCHWCHVMAHESFEDEKIARQMNDCFVSVKVDREERPDLDALYMEAVQAMTGRGGWPMTVFLDHDARPFFAGTYFPPSDSAGMPGFPRVLEAVDDAWRNRRPEVERQAEALLEAVSRRAAPDETVLGAVRADHGGPAPSAGGRWPRLLADAAEDLAGRFDPHLGGFGPAPKFPHPAFVELCLYHHRLSGAPRSLEMATTTLAAMAAGGIYDHLGGGFHRYSTDGTWTVPHFEKMLYDQAGLVRAYLHAWQVTGDARWLGVVEETVGYVLRDLAEGSGGLCSSQDADSDGEEGRFYVWTPGEIRRVLPPQLAPAAIEWYGVSEAGNFEGSCVLRRPPGAPLARPDEVEEARRLLFEARSTRPNPGRDDKVLTEWNAMFGAALAESAAVTGNEYWADAAETLGEFLLARLRRDPDGRWLRSWRQGCAAHLAYASDHAWLVEFFTRLAELTGRSLWLDRAVECARAMLELFARPGFPLYTTGRDAERLVLRPVELADGSTPSATSVAGGALVRLGALAGEEGLSERGAQLLSALLSLAETSPLAVSSALCAAGMLDGGVTEVVIGAQRADLLEVARSRYSPTQVLAWGEQTASPLWENRHDPLAYVCRDHRCAAPASSERELAGQLDEELEADRAAYALALARSELQETDSDTARHASR